MLDCIIDAVLKPDVAGPTKASGAMKHPDMDTPSTTIKSNLLIIESPQEIFYSFIQEKKREQIVNFHTTFG